MTFPCFRVCEHTWSGLTALRRRSGFTRFGWERGQPPAGEASAWLDSSFWFPAPAGGRRGSRGQQGPGGQRKECTVPFSSSAPSSALAAAPHLGEHLDLSTPQPMRYSHVQDGGVEFRWPPTTAIPLLVCEWAHGLDGKPAHQPAQGVLQGPEALIQHERCRGQEAGW